MAETGEREFDIFVEGVLVYDNINVVELAGGASLTVVALGSGVNVSDGSLSLFFGFSGEICCDVPFVSGIEINTNATGTSSPSSSPSSEPTVTVSSEPSTNPSSPPTARSCGALINCFLVDLATGTALAPLTAMDTIMYTIGSSYSISCELAGQGDFVTSVYGNGENHTVSTPAPNALYWVEDDVGGVANPSSYLATVGHKSIQVSLLLNGVTCVSYTQLLLASA